MKEKKEGLGGTKVWLSFNGDFGRNLRERGEVRIGAEREVVRAVFSAVYIAGNVF